ncbi:NAD-dependent dehydratase [Aquipseudomonas alcaligenes]|uniref:NAD-dependent dehydratase n=1 Tax=Aquipseudomonas alcaligenes TaxID=43263 RepID=A0A2V4KSR3_AQUAC|nr:NAD-dependent dehydratase [Pseudomonas alcaligenes]
MAHVSRFTVLGAGGFIGRHLVAHLRASGHQVLTPARDVSLAGQAHGHLIYAVGLTGDFRQRPLDAVDAHVGLLARVLREASFESFLYLSSTRVYGGLSADQLAQEDMDLPQRPTLDGLYDLSKLLGESMCLAQNHPAVRVVRLSNVYGVGQSPHTFLQMVLAELLREGEVTIGEAAESTKDYVSLRDVIELIPRISEHGDSRLYNLASGINLSHRELAERLQVLTGARVRFAEDGVCRRFPRIDISRISRAFAWQPRSLLVDLPELLGR